MTNMITTVKVPKKYEAYLYKITVNHTGKIYLGWHLGKTDGTYLHSCKKNKVFRKDFAKNDNTYEILDYGTATKMATKEYEMLKEVDAKNNEDYYNGSHGGGIYVKKTAYKGVIQLYQDIMNKKFAVEMFEKETLEEIERFQVRIQNTDTEHLKKIKDAMRDLHGDLTEWEPIHVLLDFYGKGKHALINGNHTLIVALELHHVLEVPVMYIPKKVWTQFDEIDLITLANLLNPQPEKAAKPAEKEDWVVVLVRKYNEKKIEIDAEENVKILKTNNLSTTQIKKIFKNAQEELEDAKLLPTGWRLINWKLKHKKTELDGIIAAANDKDTVAFNMSSANFDIDTLMDKTDAILDGKTGKKNIIVYVTHPSMKSKKEWDSVWSAKVEKRLTRYIEPLDFFTNVIQMAHMEKHTLGDI